MLLPSAAKKWKKVKGLVQSFLINLANLLEKVYFFSHSMMLISSQLLVS